MDPVSKAERITVIDILRGWAIFGMLIVNLSHDLPWSPLFAKWSGTADGGAYQFVNFFANGKFYTLFSFLFGLGFSIQMGRAEARGARFFSFYSRRLLGLLFIGLLYRILGPYGQLIIYAAFGFLLFPFRTRSPKTILIAALLCLLIPRVYEAVTAGIHERRLTDPRTAQQTAREDQQRAAATQARREHDLRLHSEGSFREITKSHARELAQNLISGHFFVGSLGAEFPLLLLGLYVGRRRIFENIPAHVGFIRRVMWWGMALGLVSTGVWWVGTQQPTGPAWPWWARQLAHFLDYVGQPALCFCYASAISLLAQREVWKKRLAPLAATGRTALSNYILHGLLFVLLFYSYALGLYGKIGPLVGLALAALIFPIEVLASVWWVRRFRFGPAEWFWRTLTYGKLQPMRLATAR